DLPALPVAIRERVVERLRPEILGVRLVWPVMTAQGEIVKELAAGSEVAVQLEDGTCMSPPILAVNVGDSGADRSVRRRSSSALLDQLLLVLGRIDRRHPVLTGWRRWDEVLRARRCGCGGWRRCRPGRSGSRLGLLRVGRTAREQAHH